MLRIAAELAPTASGKTERTPDQTARPTSDGPIAAKNDKAGPPAQGDLAERDFTVDEPSGCTRLYPSS